MSAPVPFSMEKVDFARTSHVHLSCLEEKGGRAYRPCSLLRAFLACVFGFLPAEGPEQPDTQPVTGLPGQLALHVCITNVLMQI